MSDKITSRDRSVSVGGDANAPVTNIQIGQVSLAVQQQINRELPSHLGAVIAMFSSQELSAQTARRPLPPEVSQKLIFNNLPEDHYLLDWYYRYSLELTRAYKGAEQVNPNARVAVRLRARSAYIDYAETARMRIDPPPSRSSYAAGNAASILVAVIEKMMEEYKSSSGAKVEQEMARLAISLVVADAVVECDVLEEPTNAATS